MKEHKSLIRWVEEHKKELKIAGISAAAVILLIVGIMKRESLAAWWDWLSKTVNRLNVKVPEEVALVPVELTAEPLCEATTSMDLISDTISIEVPRHIRNLPAGQHASLEKVAKAVEMGIPLEEGQTWVKSYWKGGRVA